MKKLHPQGSKEHEVSVTVNGIEQVSSVEPRLLLVHFLREKLQLTGTHVGCDTTQCGACTVLVNGEAVKSCAIFAVQVNGGTITTIEGVSSEGELHPIQQAFADNHALQCGFCTPGFIMAALQLIERYPDPAAGLIKYQLNGNICRCTGYLTIVKAIQDAARALRHT